MPGSGQHKNILILGGTREAAALAFELHETGEYDVTTSLAGRTKEPAPVAGQVRIGGFGGVEGLAAYLRDNAVDKVIDATHPFATTISANAVKACGMTGVPLEIRTRQQWEKVPGDNWLEVSDLEEAARALPSAARVFLALGRQYLDAFKARSDCHFVIRMVDEPSEPLGFANCVIIAAKPSAHWHEEQALFQKHQITHLVARNSGGDGGYAKIIAAREMGLPVVMVGRI
jgi:precorrin-6A/cobalt-precorrin-6A reductase